MNIELPENFVYKGSGYAYVSTRKILIIKGNIDFSKLMYSLTYELKDSDRCFYCGRRLNKHNITLDHMFPQDRGGATIPQNLVPCCKECNETKGKLNAEEFGYFRSINDYDKREEYRRFVENKSKQAKKIKGAQIPKKWLINPKNINILVNINLADDWKRTKKYQKIKKMYKEYKHLIFPVIVDKNNVILDGFYTLMFAKKEQISEIPVIKLDNVERHL